MTNFSRRAFLRALTGVAGWLLFSRSSAAQPEPIRIGHQLDKTGLVATFGKWHKEALKAAIKHINETGGIAGRKVELISSDDAASNAEIGSQQFQKLVQEKRVDFAIGSVLSETNIATAPLAKELKTVYFPQGIATDITGTKGNRWIFKSYHTVRAAVEAGHLWALENLGEVWTIIHSELAFAKAQAEGWASKIKEAGGEVLNTISVPPRPADFLPFLSKIDLNKTKVLYQAFTAVETIRFMQQAFELGVQKKVQVLGLIEGVDILDVSKPPFEGTWYITSYPRFADQVPSELREFDRLYRSAVGIGADGFALASKDEVVPLADLFGSWHAVSLIKRGVELSNWKSKADNKAFIQALELLLAVKASALFPQGDQILRDKDHLAFHDHYFERVDGGQLKVKARIPKEKSLYPPLADYTKEGF